MTTIMLVIRKRPTLPKPAEQRSGAHLLSATNPENGTVTYTYNSNHLLATKTDANAQEGNYTLSYSYDGFNRLTTVTQRTQQTPTGTKAAFVKLDSTTKGNWTGTYGADGYVVVGDQSFNPAYVTPTASGSFNMCGRVTQLTFVG